MKNKPMGGRDVLFTDSINPYSGWVTLTTNPPQYIKGNGTVVTSTPTTLEVVKKLNEKSGDFEGAFIYLLDGDNEYIYYRVYFSSTETNIELWNSYSNFSPEQGALATLKEVKDHLKTIYKTLK